MKNLIVLAMVCLVSSSAFAGKMKEVWALTNESIFEVLSADEDSAEIEGYQIIPSSDGGFTVHTKVTAFEGTLKGTYQCVTTFRDELKALSVVETQCQPFAGGTF